jgi:hypothetical protein
MTGKRKSGQQMYVMYSNTPLVDIKERLAFILCYLKNNPTQEVQTDLFGIEQRQCCEFVHGLRTILNMVLESAAVMPTSTNEELQDVLSANKDETNILFHDGTEREIPRPQDEDEQKENHIPLLYSEIHYPVRYKDCSGKSNHAFLAAQYLAMSDISLSIFRPPERNDNI